MAQASNVQKAVQRSDPARQAYLDLEGSLHDLLIMSKIAAEQVFTCVGELNCVDGEPNEAPTGQDVQAALFATSHVVGMLRKLLDDYEKGFETFRPDAAR